MRRECLHLGTRGVGRRYRYNTSYLRPLSFYSVSNSLGCFDLNTVMGNPIETYFSCYTFFYPNTYDSSLGADKSYNFVYSSSLQPNSSYDIFYLPLSNGPDVFQKIEWFIYFDSIKNNDQIKINLINFPDVSSLIDIGDSLSQRIWKVYTFNGLWTRAQINNSNFSLRLTTDVNNEKTSTLVALYAKLTGI